MLLLMLVLSVPCGEDKIRELLSPSDDTVELQCSVTLDQDSYVLNKHIVIAGEAASGITLDCGGSRIVSREGYSVAVQSLRLDNGWSRPVDVTIKNCRIQGNVRIFGMAPNGEGALLRESSRMLGHTERAQDAAPTRVHLEMLTVEGDSTVPIYFGPGVTESSLTHSHLTGGSNSVAVYLDAESARNRITDNFIAVRTSHREQVAVDGSAENVIANNRFSALSFGGVYVYRNCGEGGTVRHQPPKRNRIQDNYFYYDTSLGLHPAIWIGSRFGVRTYCQDDDGYPFGSSDSDLDFARDNIVLGNQIYRLPVAQMIRVFDWPNDVRDNVTIAPRLGIGCSGNARESMGERWLDSR